MTPHSFYISGEQTSQGQRSVQVAVLSLMKEMETEHMAGQTVGKLAMLSRLIYCNNRKIYAYK